MAEGSLFFYA